MKTRSAVVAVLVGFCALIIPELVHAERKLAVLKVEGMVCSS
jgi:hypothetical protein